MALVPIIFLALFFFLIMFCNSLFFKPKNKLLLVAVLFVILFLVLVGLTTYYSLIELSKVESYDKLGPFGDYIGGVLNPIISTFAVFAAGFAFYAQYEANIQVRKQFEKQEEDNKIDKRISYYKEKISLIKLEINNFYFSYNETIGYAREQKFNYEGSQAIFKLLHKIKKYHTKEDINIYNIFPKLGELESLLLFFNLTINELSNDKLLTLEDKKSLFEITEYLFYSKLKYNFDSLTKYKTQYDKPCKDCGEYHGIPEKVFNYFENIEISMNSINIAFKLQDSN